MSNFEKVRDFNRGLDERIEQIKLMANSYVLVGFQEDTLTRDETKKSRHKEGGKQMAQIAAENEFGTSKIPARPFLRPAFDENQGMINTAITDQYDRIVEGKTKTDKSLNLIGQLCVRLVKQKIRSIQYPPNSPVTIALKGSSKPLIDFGQMVQSVNYKVVLQ